MEFLKSEYKDIDLMPERVHWNIAAGVSLITYLISMLSLQSKSSVYQSKTGLFVIIFGYILLAVGAYLVSKESLVDVLHFGIANGVMSLFFSLVSTITMPLLHPDIKLIFGLLTFSSLIANFVNSASIYSVINFLDWENMVKSVKISIPTTLASVLLSHGLKLYFFPDFFSLKLSSLPIFNSLQVLFLTSIAVYLFLYVLADISVLSSGSFAAFTLVLVGFSDWLLGFLLNLVVEMQLANQNMILTKMAIASPLNFGLILAGLLIFSLREDLIEILMRGY